MVVLIYRADLARAIEKWGGVTHLAAHLQYGVSPRVTGVRQSPVKHDQEAILSGHDDVSNQSGTICIRAMPAFERVRAVATARLQQGRPEQQDSRQAVDEVPSKPARPADVSERDKQPIVHSKRRIILRHKSPRLPSMRTEIDGW